MTRLGFAINLHRCIGCRTCTIACKMENAVGEGLQRIRVLNSDETTTYDKPTGTYPNLDFFWQPTPCQQCQNPSCLDACPTGATTKREDGIVVVNQETCIGCQACVAACPYGARALDTSTNKIDKCDMCAHRLDAGLPTTMCQLCCPNRAIATGDLDDPASPVAKIIEENDAQQLQVDPKTGPNVYYWYSVK